MLALFPLSGLDVLLNLGAVENVLAYLEEWRKSNA
jgi:hypothetical protein